MREEPKGRVPNPILSYWKTFGKLIYQEIILTLLWSNFFCAQNIQIDVGINESIKSYWAIIFWSFKDENLESHIIDTWIIKTTEGLNVYIISAKSQPTCVDVNKKKREKL